MASLLCPAPTYPPFTSCYVVCLLRDGPELGSEVEGGAKGPRRALLTSWLSPWHMYNFWIFLSWALP